MLRRNPHGDLSVPCCDRAGSRPTFRVRPPYDHFQVQESQGEDQLPHSFDGSSTKRGRSERRKLVRDVLRAEAVGSTANQEERKSGVEASKRPPGAIRLRLESLDVPELSTPVSRFILPSFLQITYHRTLNSNVVTSGTRRTQRSTC